jgi:hypothetical protein
VPLREGSCAMQHRPSRVESSVYRTSIGLLARMRLGTESIVPAVGA